MQRIYSLTVMSALLIIAVFISGCYTIVGYPPELQEGFIEKGADRVYEYPEYYHDYPYSYSWDYYDPYYGLVYPYSYYYWDYPGWHYYDDYYYWDYDHSYVPEKKPETRYRGSSELHRSPASEQKRSGSLEENKETKQSSSEIRSNHEAEDKTQKSAIRHRGISSGSKKPEKSQDEER